MSILVIGATSQIGIALLPMLESAQHAFVAVSRIPFAHWPFKYGRCITASLPDLAAIDANQFDTLISFGPMDAVAEWLQTSNAKTIRRLIATSSMSAVSKQNSIIDADRALSQTLRNNEQALIDACEQLNIQWTLFRPTMIYGMGVDKNLTPIARKAMRLHLFPRIAANGLRQPVHAQDIAEAVMRALAIPEAYKRLFEIGGGECITVAEMFKRVQASLPSKTVPIHIPMSGLKIMTSLIPSWRGPFSRLQEHLIADNHDLEQILGTKPRAFQPDPDTWRQNP